jgi:PAS domain S-box-containing protein/putative nucleotidyltransferase with HDIG domain
MQSSLHFLLLEDSADDAELIVHELRSAGFEFVWERVDNGLAFDQRLTPQIDVVLADYSLPGFTGIEALKRLQARGLDIPFILLSGTIGEESAVQAMHLGAADYLMKDRLARLGPAIKQALEKRQTRETLQEYALLAKGAIDSLTAHIAILDQDGGIVMVNQAWTDFALANTPSNRAPVGIGADYFATWRRAAQDGDQEAAKFEQGMRSVLKGEAAYFEWEYPCHSPEELRWFVCRVTGFGAGANRRLVVAHQNITSIKLAEAELRESEALNRAIVDTAADAIITRDVRGTIRTFNAAAVRMYGYEAAEIIGRHMRYLIPESMHSIFEKNVNEFKNTFEPCGLALRREGAGKRKDGTTFPLEFAVSAVHAGDTPLYTIILRDITERKQAQEIIHRQFERLTALRAIDSFISASLDLRVTLQFLMDQILSLLQVDAASALIYNRHTHRLEFAAGKGFRFPDQAHRSLHIGVGPIGSAVLERHTIHIENMRLREETSFPDSLVAQEGFIAYMAVPLLAKGQVIGVLELFHRAPLCPDEDWHDFLKTLAGQMAIAVDNATLFDDLQRTNIKLTLAYDATIEGWSRALDLRDKETEGHTLRVTEMTLRLARAMGIGEDEMVHVRRGALLHDIGKMGIPDTILLKPGPLTAEEQQIMSRHPEYAYDMLYPIAFLRPALDIPLYHHEKWDGTGYPRRLKGVQIPLTARIFAVADVWDALRSDRPYREAWPPERVRDHIRSLAGSHFDPTIVDMFLTLETG